MSKEILVVIGFLFLTIFLLNTVSAQNWCWFALNSADCEGTLLGEVVMSLSSPTNAHGALAGQGTFAPVLCCNLGEGDTTCTADNKIIGLSSSTNAHAEIPDLVSPNYNIDVCYDSLKNCRETTGSCSTADEEIEVLYLSSGLAQLYTNAHIEGAGQSQNYNSKICCTVELPLALCSLTSAEWQYEEVVEGADIGAIVNGTGCSGVEISFEVLRRKSGPDEPCNSIDGCTNPSNVVFGAGDNSVTGTWTAAPSHDNEYYFVATVVATGETVSTTSDLLVEELPPEYCLSKTICSQYEESYCNSDPCGVAEASVPTDVDCSDPGINCECIWEDNECKAGWGGGKKCGNNVINPGESCDGSLLDGYSCTDFDEFTGGDLLCNSQCTGFITSSCTDYSCNNDGIRDVGEEACDGNDLGGFSCIDFDEFTEGTLLCNSACDFDTGQCTPSNSLCGNSVLDSGETCDGSLLDGYSCTDFDEFTGGTLLCNSQCTGFITSSCTGYSCNNDGIRDVGEEACDGNDLGGFSCTDFDEFIGGDLLCNSACDFDTGQCTGGGLGDSEVGTCVYTQFTDDTCDDDGFLTFSWTAAWIWDEGCGVTCQTENSDLAAQCVDGQKTVECPAQIPLPFFNIYSFVATLMIIAMVYVILILKKEKRKR